MHAFRCGVMVLLAGLMLSACDHDAQPTVQAANGEAIEHYKPGMGDLMSTLQLRHAKLWYAAQAQNWDLVEFELHEIDESFERVVRWHPEEDGISVPSSLETHLKPARETLAKSASSRNLATFETAFDRLTQGCNGCHRSMAHGFIVIQRPSAPPVSNQQWDVQ